MGNTFFILDQNSPEGQIITDVFSSTDKEIKSFSVFEKFAEALRIKNPSVIFINRTFLGDIEIGDVLLLVKAIKQKPILILFDEKEVLKQDCIRFIKEGFDGFVSVNDIPEYIENYVDSLLRIRTESQTALSNGEIFQMLFETMFSAYALHEIIVDDKGKPINYKYLEVNPAFERITGLKAKKVIGKTLLDLFPDANPQVIEKYGEVALQNKKLQFEQFSEEHKKYFEVIAFSPQRGQFSTIFTDVTEYKEALEMLQKSEAQLKELNETKDKFFSIIAHDLKNPFHHILGFVDVLHSDYNDYSEDEKKELIEQIKKSTESAYNLLINLLEWSRMQLKRISFEPIEFDIYVLAKEEIAVQQHVANSKNISIQNEIENDLTAFADVNMIRTVLRNLISNAIKFSNEGSQISITGNSMPKFITICVEDKGVGISDDRLKTLFTLKNQQSTLGTAQEKGTGLGLNLCKEFIEQNKGKIWAESQPGIGSRFNFLLPNK